MAGSRFIFRQPWLLRLTQFIVAVLLMRQIFWSLWGRLNPDEFENAQVLWLLLHDIWPGRDYYHSHPAFFNFLLYPFYRACGPTPEMFSWVRAGLLPISLLPFWQLSRLTQRVAAEKIVPWLALALFLTASFAARSLVESRPDTLQVPFILAGLLATLAYLDDRHAARARLATAAVCFGVALLFGNKVVLVILATAWALERFHDRFLHWSFARRLWRLALFGAVLLVPELLYWGSYAAFGRTDLLRSLFALSSLQPLVQPAVALALPRHLLLICLVGPVVILLGLLGLYGVWRPASEPGMPSAAVFLLGSSALALLAQALLMPVNLPHLSVLPLLLLSILAALWLRRRPGWVVAGCLLISLLVGIRFDAHQFETRRRQLDAFRYLLEVAPRDRPILDGYSGFACFRPIVGRLIYYRPRYFDIPESDEGAAEIIDHLRDRGFAAVVVDPAYPEMMRGIRTLIERNYEPSVYPEIRLPRKTVAAPDALR
ncbi:MAG: hypothetical protein GX444_01510 [Myxococcales bacterium]|nr:hypothetical protein [Myxococcales bacterium]